ncbi:MAG: saccharopine dehydrogenase C-terminal domain-containing protein [Candidatus Omnitrophica bacterium]|nr:saccharopine dehydrogenase C-terminal domain-containing protein [Candidatus Omnitrophota bacterium]MDD5671542.1 saccharopine dehydrogenase C-terminal domain-containing protein [Candidatus Omnitrophota bacterium]
MLEFKNKVLIIGYGSVSKCTLPILLRHIKIPYKNITIIDFADKRKDLQPWIKRGIQYFQERITPINVARTLSRHVSSGGMVIDVAWNIDCQDMVNWCHDNQVLYVNTSVEEWDPYANIENKTPFEKSLYYKQMELRKLTAKWNHDATTAVLDHGANPGLISHFTKKALVDIAEKSIRDKGVSKTATRDLERLVRDKKFASLAMKLGVKVIHVSERDTQITNKPKRVDEFVGTWSIEGLREEAISPAEIGWGTHEKEVPAIATVPHCGPKNQIFLSQMGMNTWVRSWVPYQEIVGMVIRHAESFTISDRLTVWRAGKVCYRPTVHYAYMPCDETIASLHELRCRNYELQPDCRILSDEITSGYDILGALLMGHRYNSWWTGSMLSIEEARRLVPHQNATTMQVAIGVVAATMWMIENPRCGLCEPDELPHEFVLHVARPYLGELISVPSEWTPLKNYQIIFKENPYSYLDKKNVWSFQNFLFRN